LIVLLIDIVLKHLFLFVFGDILIYKKINDNPINLLNH